LLLYDNLQIERVRFVEEMSYERTNVFLYYKTLTRVALTTGWQLFFKKPSVCLLKAVLVCDCYSCNDFIRTIKQGESGLIRSPGLSWLRSWQRPNDLGADVKTGNDRQERDY